MHNSQTWPNNQKLKDGFNRQFTYLRLSITDVCNYRCNYCLPDGYDPCQSDDDLSFEQLQQLVESFANMGIKKIRITGGEPAVRKDLTRIIKMVKHTPGIETVALTTNGYKLNQHITNWIEAGLDQINVSIDSLQPEMFRLITGHDRLHEILAGIETAQKHDFKNIKINAVLLKQFNRAQLGEFLQWIKHKPVSLRFIELMETGDNTQFFKDNHVSGQEILALLQQQGWVEKIKGANAGPAREFSHSDYQGSMGLIMPYSSDFCATCNRLRISSSGKLHLCLFGDQGYDLKPFLDANDETGLSSYVQETLYSKEATHYLHQNYSGSTRHLAMLGG